MFGVGAIQDPFYVTPEIDGGYGKVSYRNLDGRIRVDPRFSPSDRVLTLVCAGQSNIANTSNALYTPTHTGRVLNLNIWDGGVYQLQDPVIGASSYLGCWLGRMGDMMINTGRYDRVIFVPIAMGATYIAEHVPGALENRKYIVAVERCRALGLPIDAFLWMQGEFDHATTQADYQSRLLSVINTPRSIGEQAPWFIGKCTLINGVTSAPVRAAQAAVVNGVDIFAGADTDTLTGVGKRYDGTHLSAIGANDCADLWVSVLTAALS